jgi:carbamate kinase
MIQNTAARDITPEMPMYASISETQGLIGLMIQNALMNILNKEEIESKVVTVLSQIEVDPNDPAFNEPTKPVGTFYTKEEAEEIVKEKGYTMKEDAGRGYRRVVYSPLPMRKIEIDAMKELLEKSYVIIDGGGMPVINENGNFKSVDVVVDKDRVAAMVADEIDADMLIILTAVNKIAINFGKENQQWLEKVSIEDAKKYIEEGQFAAGSMLPKVEGAIDFISKNSERKALITHPDYLKDGLDEKDGTWIVF